MNYVAKRNKYLTAALPRSQISAQEYTMLSSTAAVLAHTGGSACHGLFSVCYGTPAFA